jgi:hypothetical protein
MVRAAYFAIALVALAGSASAQCCKKTCLSAAGGTCDDDKATNFCAPNQCVSPNYKCSGTAAASSCVKNDRYPGKVAGSVCDPALPNTCADKTLTSASLKCINDGATDAGVLDKTCQREKWMFPGQACTQNFQCEKGNCVNNICEITSATGVACSKDDDCSYMNYCHPDNKTCMPVVLPGGACTDKNKDVACPHHASCVLDVAGTSGVCRVRYSGGLGDRCANDEECASAYCTGDVCTAPGALPASLTTLPLCAAGVCTGGGNCICDETTGKEVCVTGTQDNAINAAQEVPAKCETLRAAYVSCVNAKTACGRVPTFTPNCCFEELGQLKGCALDNMKNAAWNPDVKCKTNTAATVDSGASSICAMDAVLLGGAAAGVLLA